jgi:hypothetical protein
MTLEDIKNDIKKQEMDTKNKYDLTEGTHILLIDLNSKEKGFYEYEDKKVYYQKFTLVNNEGKYVIFSNYLYAEFLKALKPVINEFKDNHTVIETIIKVTKTGDKTNYDVKINTGEKI